MSIWQILNGAAWALSAVLFAIMALDFIRTERRARRGGKRDDS
jgi:hypothetical protein